jgi:hypothetical protein
MEMRFTNMDEDLTITEVSSEARRLFGEEYFTGVLSLEGMRKSMQARVGEPQYSACRKFFRKMLRELDARLSVPATEEEQEELRGPISGVPMIFREEFDKPAGQPRLGHLPLIVRHATDGVVKTLRVIYVPVSKGLRLTDQGYYVCEL